MKIATSKLIYTRQGHQIKEIATQDTAKSRHLVERLCFFKKRINLPNKTF